MTTQPLSWLAESLRITILLPPNQSVPPERAGWWEGVTGNPPETSSASPRAGSFQDEGLFGDDRLVLRILPGRVDWILAPTTNESENFASLGSFQNAIDKFLPVLSEKWFASSPTPHRVAFGAVLLHPVGSKEEGYKFLQSLIRAELLSVEPNSISDFMLQINRPKKPVVCTEVSVINRLSKWSVASVRKVQFSFGPESSASFLSPEIFACRLELDINTPPDFQGKFNDLKNIFTECKDLALEISREGDVA